MDLHAIIDAVQQAAPYAFAVLVATTALAHTLKGAAHAFARYAATTPTPKDDEVAARLVAAAEKLSSWLDLIGTWLPQVGFGRRLPSPGGSK